MCASRVVARRVRELFEAIRPAVTEMIEKNGPSVEGLKFSDIEGNSVAAGDLVARRSSCCNRSRCCPTDARSR